MDRIFRVFEEKKKKIFEESISPPEDMQEVKVIEQNLSITQAKDDHCQEVDEDNNDGSHNTEEIAICNISATTPIPQLLPSTISPILDLRTNPLQEKGNDEHKSGIDIVIEEIRKIMESSEEEEEFDFKKDFPVAYKHVMIRPERKPI